MVQGAGDPAFEQRRDQVDAGQHGRRVGRVVAGGVVMDLAHVAWPAQPSGAVGVDGRAGLDDTGGRGLVRAEPDPPFFCDVTNQVAANHVASGVRVQWKIVPTVTDVCRPQAAHMSSALPVRQHAPAPQRGQTNPSRLRSRCHHT
ncbi:hypothetical protein E1269_27955 [Jiangella asiatica]|uniref:Uncharacterized protein n=1 Tax=Jiangella asiatica TaxID=2530372 RepID=A0A4R5CN50_9ACTN|nr:hypothetical protein E1269_27955 [Jiangella asiatica]